MMGWGWLPKPVFGKQGIGQHEEFAGDGDEGELLLLSGLDQAFADRADALDASFPLASAGLVGDRSEASEQRDRLPI